MATYRSKRLERKRNNPYNGAEILKVHRRVFPRESIWPWVISISLLCIFVVVGIFTFSLVWSVESARDKASAAIDGAGEFLAAAKAGDQELLEQSASNVSDAAHGIKDELNGSIWELAARMPIVGTDIENIRTLADVLIDFADNALIPMSESGNILALKDFAEGDSIDIAVIPQLLVAIDEAMPVLNRSADVLSDLPPARLWAVRKIMDKADSAIGSAGKFLTQIRPLFPYIPDMVGADGQAKHYLILAENTAEIHAAGGFVGALGIMTIENGKIEMSDFKSLSDALSYGPEPSGATEEEIELFGDRCNINHGDHNVIPDFSRVGQLYFNVWNLFYDYEVDGVIGMDPVFLQYLLRAVGEIETSYGVSVNGDNAAAVLLNQSLFWWQPEECDGFYSEVASKTLYKLMGNLDDADLTAMLNALIQASEEGRLLIWMRDEEIEEALKRANYAGELKHDISKPELGIYISDFSTSKMSYYLSGDVEVSNPTANQDGSETYSVRVEFKNNFDQDARDVFPSYIKVIGVSGRSECDLCEEITIIAPAGGHIDSLTSERVNTRGGTPSDSHWSDYEYQGLEAKHAIYRLDSNESVIIEFDVTTAPDPVDELTVRKTPLMPPEIAYWNVDISGRYPHWNIEKTV